jgi:hypothetical protein
VSDLLRPLAPPPEDDEIAARLAYFADHRDDFDLIYIGSSNFRLGVDPQRVDEVLAERGHPVRSFSFGVEGMNAFESRYLLDRVLELEPAHLRWVVIELLRIRPDELIGDNRFNDRVVAWHDAARTAEVIETLRRAPLGALERLDLILLHLRHVAWRVSNIGRGPAMVSALLDLDAAEAAKVRKRIARNRGFRPLGIFRGDQGPRARRELEAQWKEVMERFASTRHGDGSTDVFDTGPIQRQVAALEARGIEPIYVISPVGRGTPVLDRLAAEGALPRPLVFNRPEEYPALYDVNHRFDVTHLNAQGARIWSRLLGEQIADRMDEAARR